MCFSPEASFAGSAVIGTIGIATLKTSFTKKKALLTSIPLLFALQQFCEGIVWLEMQGVMAHSNWTILAKNLFLFFALGLWPTFVPLAMLLAEPKPEKKKPLFFLLALGIIASYLSLSSYPIQKLYPEVVGHSLQYLSEAPLYKKGFYLFVIVFPFLYSSLRWIWIFGVLILISFFFTEYFYAYASTSVWCFFSALLSVSLYFILKNKTHYPETH